MAQTGGSRPGDSLRPVADRERHNEQQHADFNNHSNTRSMMLPLIPVAAVYASSCRSFASDR
jgi:hypothetical protein